MAAVYQLRGLYQQERGFVSDVIQEIAVGLAGSKFTGLYN
jgi:hypothetical protein